MPTTTEPQSSMIEAKDANELAELIQSFNQVTNKLEKTHLSLRDEVVRLQEELQNANLELERSRRLAALGEMAAGIAHEVRNPLGSIGLYANILAEDLAGEDEQQRLAQRIGSAVRGLDAVVNDVLSFSRDLHTNNEQIDPEDIVTEAITRCADLLAEPNAPKIERTKTTLDLTLHADSRLLVQAMTNVLRNAIEASAEHHPVVRPRVALAVRTSAEVAGSSRSGPMLEFHVEDTGKGISDEVLERMFNPFFTTRDAGTGLGLSIVHRIIEAHGGRVCVAKSKRLGGTSFKLLLPINGIQESTSNPRMKTA
jgi:signal transduction histidine kinase